MKVKIEDVHGAHGLVFTLAMKKTNNKQDLEVMRFLNSALRSMTKSKNAGQSALYTYSVEVYSDCCKLKFAEAHKHLAKVDYYWSEREDQKFKVLMVHEGSDDDECVHYKCHWCHEETWGVGRHAVEVYDQESNKMKLVNVHIECQEKREKQMASIPFEK